MTFKIGDHVMVDDSGWPSRGTVGKIRRIDRRGMYHYEVAFDSKFSENVDYEFYADTELLLADNMIFNQMVDTYYGI